ncbi:helix-turn-helix domain-containing protein [Actinomadura sp. 3N407]|uniref:helix-turn-helix transcriptional regulator n=1 Tax=Actinomadura sp. 3N407 TaxID=3457423 RepID=UPI003FCE5C1B
MIQARAEGDEVGVVQALAAQGVAALFAGDFDLSLQLLGSADRMCRDNGDDDMLILLIDVFRGVACLFRNDFPAAIAHADRATRNGEERGELWGRSYGMLVCGLALWLAGDLEESMRRLRSSLRIKRDLDDGLGMTLGLEAIAGCLCSRGEFVRAARLLGAADRMREYTQTSWLGPHHALLRETHIDMAVKALGQERYRTAFEEGERLPLAHAVQDALDVSPPTDAASADGSGKAVGSSLTERELQVAALVAEGLSNREIAERLTIAKRTADSHVEHILGKLGYSSRAQIAVWISTQKDG